LFKQSYLTELEKKEQRTRKEKTILQICDKVDTISKYAAKK